MSSSAGVWTDCHESVTGLGQDRVEVEARAVAKLELDHGLLDPALAGEPGDLPVDPVDEVFVRALLARRPEIRH